jgi:hypothetical protein
MNTAAAAIDTMRMSVQLQMKRHQVDFLRNIVTARNTKNGTPRDIPMNDDVRQALADSAKTKILTSMCSAVTRPAHVFAK